MQVLFFLHLLKHTEQSAQPVVAVSVSPGSPEGESRAARCHMLVLARFRRHRERAREFDILTVLGRDPSFPSNTSAVLRNTTK